MLKNLVLLLRPKQWAKNLLVFAAWMFAGRFTDQGALYAVCLAFVAMTLASSSIYIFNDVVDVERDRSHPKKKNRPIASGAVSVPIAIGIGLVLLGSSLYFSWSLNPTCFALLVTYLVLQVAYNLKLKSVPVLDVFVIAFGFIIRAVLGAAALVVPTSGWFLFCTGALALMLGFAKRRNEFIVQAGKHETSRESLVHYSRQALDTLVVMFATCAAICYVIYTLESSTARAHPAMIITAPFVLYGVTRYLLRVFREDEGGEPADLLFGDWHIVGSVILFVVAAGLSIGGAINLPFLIP